MSLRTIWKNFIKNQYIKLFKKEINSTKVEISTLKIDKSVLNLDITTLDSLLKKKTDEIAELREEIKELKVILTYSGREEVKLFDTVTNVELRTLLKPHCKSYMIKLSDSIYGLTTQEEAKKFTEATKLSINEWKKNEYDCDEFSFALMGYWNLDLHQFAFGVAWSKTHAFNIMLDNDGQVWIIEPQTNKFMKIDDVKDNEKYYPMEMIII